MKTSHLIRPTLLLFLLGITLPGFAGANLRERLTIVVVVIESLMPHELATAGELLPTLHKLRGHGTWYENSRGVFPARTLPGHASLLTGVHPESHGVINDLIWDRKKKAGPRPPSRPSDLQATSLLRHIHSHCPALRTGASVADSSTRELLSACGHSGTDCGAYAFAPNHLQGPNPAGSGSVRRYYRDARVMAAARAQMQDSSLLFISLQDLDATGHAQATDRTQHESARAASLQHTDGLIADLIAELKLAGRWGTTIMFITSNHGMDWVETGTPIALNKLLGDVFPGTMLGIGEGGLVSYYLRKQTPEAWRAAGEALQLLRMHPAIGGAWFTSLHSAAAGKLLSREKAALLLPLDYRARSPRLGDIVIQAAPGVRLSTEHANPIAGAGFHGHPASRNNTLLITGGMEFIRKQSVSGQASAATPYLRPASTVDIAPSISWLLGLPLETQPQTGMRPQSAQPGIATPLYEGRPLTEAFDIDQTIHLGRCGKSS